MKHYYMTYCNDGVPLFDTECSTRKAAIEELKKAFRFDFDECGHDPGFDYYIEEVWESPSQICVSPNQYYKLTMGKRGGITCKRI